jgi:photosystem II stability/assembly factor-like uncharacterized protein
MKVIKKINLLILMLIEINLNGSLFAQSGWNLLNLPSVTNSQGIYFKNSNTGIVSGFKTTNGGQTWSNPFPDSISLNAISFPDTAIGYCCTGARIYKTTNLGDNWTYLQNPEFPMNNIYFVNINTGYVCGAFNTIAKTTNSGNNWTTLTNNFPFYLNYLNLYFINASSGFIIGSHSFDTSYVIKTTNGGQNWNIKYFTGQQFYSIFFINSNNGFVGGTNLFITTNSGENWTQKFLYNSLPILSIHFPTPNTGYACYANGDIIKTIDGGNLWLRQYPVTSYALYSIFFINNDVGYACANDHGIVLKTTNGGGPPIGIKQSGTEVPNTFSLSQNYPNPFNPSTDIKYCLKDNCDVKLIIYDILGREVALIVNEHQDAGFKTVHLDASYLSTGIYFYKLIAGEFISVKKMLLLR